MSSGKWSNKCTRGYGRRHVAGLVLADAPFGGDLGFAGVFGGKGGLWGLGM